MYLNWTNLNQYLGQTQLLSLILLVAEHLHVVGKVLIAEHLHAVGKVLIVEHLHIVYRSFQLKK